MAFSILTQIACAFEAGSSSSQKSISTTKRYVFRPDFAVSVVIAASLSPGKLCRRMLHSEIHRVGASTPHYQHGIYRGASVFYRMSGCWSICIPTFTRMYGLATRRRWKGIINSAITWKIPAGVFPIFHFRYPQAGSTTAETSRQPLFVFPLRAAGRLARAAPSWSGRWIFAADVIAHGALRDPEQMCGLALRHAQPMQGVTDVGGDHI
jgi:hypothetical protein